MTGLLGFLACKRLVVSAILRCDFCNQFVECIYPKTRLMELIDASTILIAQHYGKQQSIVTKKTKIVSSPNQKSCAPFKIRFSQRVRISPFRQAIIVVELERKDSILVFPRHPLENALSAALLAEFKTNARNFSALLTRVLPKKKVLRTK